MKLLFLEVEVTISLSNIVKSHYVIQKQTKSIIIDSNELVAKKVDLFEKKHKLNNSDGEDRFQEGIVADDIEVIPEIPNEEVVANASLQAESIIEEAKKEAEAIIAKANEEAELVRSIAFDAATSDGFKEGYNDAVMKAELEYASKKEEISTRQRDLELEYQNKIIELEPKIVEKLTGIYEQIFNTNLQEYTSIVSDLILNIIQNGEGNKDYIIHVSPQVYEQIGDVKNKLTSNIPESCNVEFVADGTLNSNGCFIETSTGIYDCGIDTQLKELNRLLLLISYQ